MAHIARAHRKFKETALSDVSAEDLELGLATRMAKDIGANPRIEIKNRNKLLGISRRSFLIEYGC